MQCPHYNTPYYILNQEIDDLRDGVHLIAALEFKTTWENVLCEGGGGRKWLITSR